MEQIKNDMRIYRGDELWIPLSYPQIRTIKKFVIELSDTRAADPIRISYDFERDGWVVEQASVFEWDGDDTVCDPGWREVAFVKAWQFEEKEEKNE